jgi:hypothetical protein
MTAATPRPADPATDLRLARLHLRMGQLGLARAELEALAGSGDLDDDGLLALAEARWRTGDLTGAGEAAQAYLSTGGESITALVIAAESVAAAGRPGEARRIAGRALEQKEVPLDRIFAGMPRSSIWPVDPAEAGRPTATLFGEPAARPVVAAPPAETPAAPAEVAAPSTPDGPGLWDTDDSATLPDPADVLESGRQALAAGQPDQAAFRLGLVLRTAPDLAAAVLDATERAPRTPELEVVRGDAFGVLGSELEARRAYAAAAAALAPRDLPPSSPDDR